MSVVCHALGTGAPGECFSFQRFVVDIVMFRMCVCGVSILMVQGKGSHILVFVTGWYCHECMRRYAEVSIFILILSLAHMLIVGMRGSLLCCLRFLQTLANIELVKAIPW